MMLSAFFHGRTVSARLVTKLTRLRAQLELRDQAAAQLERLAAE